MNVAIVRGRLSSSPRLMEFESGDVLVRYEVTVVGDDGPSESVPVSWVGPPRQAPPVDLEVGTEVLAVGRVRRRFYRQRDGRQASSTELQAASVVPTSRKAAVRKALDAALAGAVDLVSGCA